MTRDWCGRYHGILRALVHHANTVNRMLNVRIDRGGYMMTAQEYQLLEMLIEHEEENLIMSDIAARIPIPQSTMTKATKLLLEYGLVERYRIAGNKKNIVLKPTEKGLQLYATASKTGSKALFAPLFEKLEPLTEEQLAIVVDAILSLDKVLLQDDAQRLIPMDKK